MTRQKGFLSVIISATIFGSMPLMANLIYNQGSNPTTLVFHRFLLVIPCLYLIIKKDKDESLKITGKELKKLIIVSGFGYTLTALLLFISFKYIPSSISMTIHFIYPILVILGLAIFFKERISRIKIISIILCTIGIITFYNKNSRINPIGILLALISGITYAFYIIYLDKSGLKNLNIFKLTFYICLIASVIILIFAIITKSLTINITPLGWVLSTFLSILLGLGGVSLYQLGIKTIGSQDTAILSTFEPVTSIILSIFVLKEPFESKTIIGIILILIAVILVALLEDDKEKEANKVDNL